MKESTLARARPPRTPTPGQLTLEDWAEVLSASRGATTVDSSASIDITEMGDGALVKSADEPDEQATRHRPVATDLLETPGALLTRTHLRALGLERRAIDAVFRRLPIVALPGYSRPMIHVEEYLDLINEHTYRDDCVRPLGSIAHG